VSLRIIFILTNRNQLVKCNGVFSSVQTINASIVQGSDIGPMLYVVMASDLKAKSVFNRLAKYANDTTLLVPSDSNNHQHRS